LIGTHTITHYFCTLSNRTTIIQLQ